MKFKVPLIKYQIWAYMVPFKGHSLSNKFPTTGMRSFLLSYWLWLAKGFPKKAISLSFVCFLEVKGSSYC